MTRTISVDPTDDPWIAQRPPGTLHPGVPPHIEEPLRLWVQRQLGVGDFFDESPNDGLCMVICLQAEVSKKSYASYGQALAMCPTESLLKVINEILRQDSIVRMDDMEFLNLVLRHGASAYRVDTSLRTLLHRVPPQAQALKDLVARSATQRAAVHLNRAWTACYGMNPDYDKAYAEAVKTVEETLCPLVSPTNPQRTLGKSIQTLRKEAVDWKFSLPDPAPGRAGPSAVERIVDLIEILWTGHHSRHGGSANSRSQTQEESEAAVQIAVTIAQWVTSGALARR